MAIVLGDAISAHLLRQHPEAQEAVVGGAKTCRRPGFGLIRKKAYDVAQIYGVISISGRCLKDV